MKKIISLILLLIISISLFTQEYYPFTEEEILNITNHIQKLELADSVNTELIKEYDIQLNNYKELIKLDSLEINHLNKEIILLKDLNKELQPTFWEKIDQYVGYTIGVLTIIGSALIVKEINK